MLWNSALNTICANKDGEMMHSSDIKMYVNNYIFHSLRHKRVFD